MIDVIIPKDKGKLKKQIEALEYLIKHDISEKDRRIHQEALKVLEQELERLEL